MANIGEIKLFAYNDIPDGFLECDGKKMKKNKYPKLYMMIGNRYGDCEEQYFRLPNLKDSTPKDMKCCIAYRGEIPNIKVGE